MAGADPNPPSAHPSASHPSAYGAEAQSGVEKAAVVMPMAVSATASLYARRRRRNGIATAVSLALTALGLACLVLILGTLLWRGLSGVTPQVFTEMTPAPPGEGGGLLNAIVGSLILTVIGVAIGAPLGILAGTYMAEYGRHDRLTSVVRFINDILLSAPSIVVGLFIYEVLVAHTIGHFSGIAGAVALAVLVIPVVVRTTEDMLLLVPNPLREAASALGLPRSVVVVRIAYRAARAGMVTGVLLAIARISGETAPLVFTSGTNQFWSVDLNHEIASLPMFIFQGANSPYPAMKQLAWTGALMITLTVLVLSITARSLTAKSTSS
jgi:phosphate transport system permease protein